VKTNRRVFVNSVQATRSKAPNQRESSRVRDDTWTVSSAALGVSATERRLEEDAGRGLEWAAQRDQLARLRQFDP
jgi:hypothetical protein